MLALAVIATLSLVLSGAAASAGTGTADGTKPLKPHLPAWDEKHGGKWPAAPMLLYPDPATYRTSHIGQYMVTKPVTGLRAYAEFEPAGHMIIAWDVGIYDTIFLGMIKAVYKTTTVIMLYDGTSAKTNIVNQLKAEGFTTTEINDTTKFLFVQTPLDAFWTRDYGPIPAVDANGNYVMVDFQYYWERVYDDGSPYAVAQALLTGGVTIERPDLKYEGGNFMTNGKGLCMASKGAIWNNLPDDDTAVSTVFHDYLGCEKTVFLKPLAGEGTTHIDMFAKIMDETTVIVGKYEYTQDCTDALILDENAALLENTTTVDGKPLKVVRIPMPDNADGVWRTYTNSLLVNNIALVPVYANYQTYEAEALKVYQDTLPGWTIVPIASDDIIPDGGAMHCITMTTPKPPYQKLTDPAALCGSTAYTCVQAGCGGITTQGSCDGNTEIWCQNGSPQSYDCAAPCYMVNNGDPCEQKCGLNGSSYDCTDAITCQCVPSCANKECGPDGCAGVCGVCTSGRSCNASGKCEITADGGTPDSGPDAGVQDSGNDGGSPDTGDHDAGIADSGSTDAGTADAGATDAGRHDAGTPDGGTTAEKDGANSEEDTGSPAETPGGSEGGCSCATIEL